MSTQMYLLAIFVQLKLAIHIFVLLPDPNPTVVISQALNLGPETSFISDDQVVWIDTQFVSTDEWLGTVRW